MTAKESWSKKHQEHYENLERDEKDFVAVISHTGGHCVVLSSSELTTLATMVGIMGKMLIEGGPICDAVLKQVSDLPDDAPAGYVERVLAKNLASVNTKFRKLGAGLSLNVELGLNSPPSAANQNSMQRYGTFNNPSAAGDDHGTVPSHNGGTHHEHQGEHAERGHGREPAERSDPHVPQHQPGQPSNPAEPQPASAS